MDQLKRQVKRCQRGIILIVLLCSCIATLATAQSIDTAYTSSESTYFADLVQNIGQLHPYSISTTKVERNHSIMLPSSSMEESYPLFCRLEDKINAGNKIQCLFRLGSLSYVNYLEQKGDHQRLMLEQIR